MPTKNDIDPDEVQAAVAALLTPQTSRDPDADLLTAGAFVADFGSPADWYEGADLVRLQFWPDPNCAAWSRIGHWSAARNDPNATPPPASFDEHEQQCATCKYLESAYGLHLTFETEFCAECGLDLDKHTIAPDAFGLAHAWCEEG